MGLREKMATLKMNRLVNVKAFTKKDISFKIGISRVTLDSRLKNGNWKTSELIAIESIFD